MRTLPKKELSLFDSTCLIVGIIIGVGIYQMAPDIAKGAGSWWGVFLIWMVGGLLSLFGALGYAELASAYPAEGGDYVYLTKAYGKWAGFLFGWIQLVIVRPGDIAVIAFAFALYAEKLFAPFARSPVNLRIYAVLSIVFLTAINILGVKEGKWTQNLLTTVKALGLLAILGVALASFTANYAPVAINSSAAFADNDAAVVILTANDPDAGDRIKQYRIETLPAHGILKLNGTAVSAGATITQARINNGDLTYEPDSKWIDATEFTFKAYDGQTWSPNKGIFTINVYSGLSDPPTPEPFPWSLALILVLFTFGGWNEMAYVAAEVKNPQRNIVRALVLGTVAVTVLYLLANGAFLRTLGYQGMAHSLGVADDTVSTAFPTIGGKIISALICISALGAVNGLIFTGARISYAVGADHRAFRPLGLWNSQTGTPVRALMLQGAIALTLVLALGSFINTIIYTAAAVYSFYLATNLAVIVLRRKEPHIQRPYKVTGYPFTTLIFCSSCALLIYSAVTYKPLIAVIACLIFLAGLPLYWLTTKKPSRLENTTQNS